MWFCVSQIDRSWKDGHSSERTVSASCWHGVIGRSCRMAGSNIIDSLIYKTLVHDGFCHEWWTKWSGRRQPVGQTLSPGGGGSLS